MRRGFNAGFAPTFDDVGPLPFTIHQSAQQSRIVGSVVVIAVNVLLLLSDLISQRVVEAVHWDY